MKKNLTTIFFIFIILSFNLCAGRKGQKICEIPIFSKFDYSELKPGDTETFSKWICNLYENNRGGEVLIDVINFHLRKENFKVHVTSSKETSFNQQQNKLEINFSALEESYTPCVGKKIIIKPLNRVLKEEKEVYEIGVCKDFAENILAHELIHMLHFLKNKQEFSDFLKEDPSTQFWIKNKDPEIERRLWKNTEEKRTVLGDPRQLDDIVLSEFDIRMLWKEPSVNLTPRYAYQAIDQHFYEEASVIEELLEDHWGSTWPEILDFLYTQQPFLSFKFDEEKAQSSLLNRFKNKDYFLISKENELKQINIPLNQKTDINTDFLKQMCNLKVDNINEDYLTASRTFYEKKEYFDAANLIIQGAKNDDKPTLKYLLENKFIKQNEAKNFKEFDLERLIQIKTSILEKWNPKNISMSDLKGIKSNTLEAIKLCN